MKRIQTPPVFAKRRAGTTLTEVLMSVLLLGIGAVTLATLFPISILRTTQAVQKTNATILRYNAEAMVDVHNLVNAADVPDPAPGAVTMRVIDPLGWHILGANPSGGPPFWRDTFGNDGTAGTGVIPRLDPTAYANSTEAATAVAALPDSFVDNETAAVASSTATTVTLASQYDLTGIPTPVTPPFARVILFDRGGRAAEVRVIDSIAGSPNVITWTGDLPAGFSVERTRIMTDERTYTWLMTVRKRELADPTVDVVVFFRRNFSPEDERVYSWPGGTTAFQQGLNEVQIDYSAVTNKPPLTVGSFVFDAENCRWYRISGVNDDASAKTAILTIDRPALESSDSAILMRGIIDVFPIGPKTPQL